MIGDGNGWAAAPHGARRWGIYGAAGLLLVAEGCILMQHRAFWTASGGTWAMPGGARDSHETAAEAALREAEEETSIDISRVTVITEIVTSGPFDADPNRPELAGGWTYTVVLATAEEILPAAKNDEAIEIAWVPLAEVTDRELMPAFAHSWPALTKLIDANL